MEAHCFCWSEGDEGISIWSATFPIVGIDGLRTQADTPAQIKLIES